MVRPEQQIEKNATRAYHELIKQEYAKMRGSEGSSKNTEFYCKKSEMLAFWKAKLGIEDDLTDKLFDHLRSAGLIVDCGGDRYRSLHMDLAVRIIGMKTNPIDPEIKRFASDWAIYIDSDKIWKTPYLKFDEDDKICQKFKKTITEFVIKNEVDVNIAEEAVSVLLDTLKEFYPAGLYEFQYRAVVEQISKGQASLIHAPTGSGKTEAFMIVAIIFALISKLKGDDKISAMNAYPRNTLSSDQASRIFGIVARLNAKLIQKGILEYGNTIRMGILDGNTRNFDSSTQLRKNGSQPFRGIVVKYDGKSFPIYYDPYDDRITVPEDAPEELRKQLEHGALLGKRSDFTGNVVKVPNILITNLWQIERILANPFYTEHLLETGQALYIVLDEFHIYTTEQRAFVRFVLNALKKSRETKITFSSATPKSKKDLLSEFGNEIPEINEIEYAPKDKERAGSPDERLQIYLLLDVNPSFSWETLVTEVATTIAAITSEEISGKKWPANTITFIDNRSNIDKIYDNISNSILLGSPKDRISFPDDPIVSQSTIKHYFKDPDKWGAKAEEVQDNRRREVLRDAIAIHYSDYENRRDVEKDLKSGKKAMVLATSTLEVGVDYENVGVIINAGLDADVSRIVQRAGRAGRSNIVGKTALVVFLARNHRPIEKMMYYIIHQKSKNAGKNNMKEILREIEKDFKEMEVDFNLSENVMEFGKLLKGIWSAEAKRIVKDAVEKQVDADMFLQEHFLKYLRVVLEESALPEEKVERIIARYTEKIHSNAEKINRNTKEILNKIQITKAELKDSIEELCEYCLQKIPGSDVTKRIYYEFTGLDRELRELIIDLTSPDSNAKYGKKVLEKIRKIQEMLYELESAIVAIRRELTSAKVKSNDEFNFREITGIINELMDILHEDIEDIAGRIASNTWVADIATGNVDAATDSFIEDIRKIQGKIDRKHIVRIINAIITFFEELEGIDLLTIRPQVGKVALEPTSEAQKVAKKLGVNIPRKEISKTELYYRYPPLQQIPWYPPMTADGKRIKDVLSPYLGVVTYVNSNDEEEMERNPNVVYYHTVLSSGLPSKIRQYWYYQIPLREHGKVFIKPFSTGVVKNIQQGKNSSVQNFIQDAINGARSEYLTRMSLVFYCKKGFGFSVDPSDTTCPFYSQCELGKSTCGGKKFWHSRSKKRYPRIMMLSRTDTGTITDEDGKVLEKVVSAQDLGEFVRDSFIPNGQESLVTRPSYLLTYIPFGTGNNRRPILFRVPLKNPFVNKKWKNHAHPMNVALHAAFRSMTFETNGDIFRFEINRTFMDTVYFELLFNDAYEEFLKKLIVKYVVWSLSIRGPYRMEIAIKDVVEEMNDEALEEIVAQIKNDPYGYVLNAEKIARRSLKYRYRFYYYFERVLANTLSKAINIAIKQKIRDENDVVDVRHQIEYYDSARAPITIDVYEKRVSGPAGLLRTLFQKKIGFYELLEEFGGYIDQHSKKYGKALEKFASEPSEEMYRYIDYYMFNMYLTNFGNKKEKYSVKRLGEDSDTVDSALREGIPLCSDGCPGCFIENRYFDNLEFSRGLYQIAWRVLTGSRKDTEGAIARAIGFVVWNMVSDNESSRELTMYRRAEGKGSGKLIDAFWKVVEIIPEVKPQKLELKGLEIEQIRVLIPFGTRHQENDLREILKIIRHAKENNIRIKTIELVRDKTLENLREVNEIKKVCSELNITLKDSKYAEQNHAKTREITMSMDIDWGKYRVDRKVKITVNTTRNQSPRGDEEINAAEVSIECVDK